jgi:hypothetical protein
MRGRCVMWGLPGEGSLSFVDEGDEDVTLL